MPRWRARRARGGDDVHPRLPKGADGRVRRGAGGRQTGRAEGGVGRGDVHAELQGVDAGVGHPGDAAGRGAQPQHVRHDAVRDLHRDDRHRGHAARHRDADALRQQLGRAHKGRDPRHLQGRLALRRGRDAQVRVARGLGRDRRGQARLARGHPGGRGRIPGPVQRQERQGAVGHPVRPPRGRLVRAAVQRRHPQRHQARQPEVRHRRGPGRRRHHVRLCRRRSRQPRVPRRGRGHPLCAYHYRHDFLAVAAGRGGRIGGGKLRACHCGVLYVNILVSSGNAAYRLERQGVGSTEYSYRSFLRSCIANDNMQSLYVC